MDYIFIIALGLVIGSFLNVCIYRIPKEESIAFPPSHCSNCNNKLKVYDLIPVVSYIFLKGRCRYCKEKISIRYPLIEILNTLLYLVIYIKFGLSIVIIKYFLFASILLVISMIDFDTQFVFTNTTIFATIAGLVFIAIQTVISKTGTVDLIAGGILGGAIIGIIVVTTKGMGTGDIEIAAICGMFIGTKGIVLGLFLAIVLGGIVGVALLSSKFKNQKDKIAFGPYIAIGSFISMVWNTEIIHWYWRLFI